MKHRIDNGMNSYDAFIECQTHLITMARAYIERVVLEQFLHTIAGRNDAPTREALKKMCQLYALKTLEDNSGWFLEQGYLEGNKSKAIRREVDVLCLEVREHALEYVEAFGVPQNSLGALVRLRKKPKNIQGSKFGISC